MIRTRDFAVFSAALVFLLSVLTATVAYDLWGTGGEMATVVKFADEAPVSGAIADSRNIDRAGNISRLKAKIAAGEGDNPQGEPIFTSVDDFSNDDLLPITDDSLSVSVHIGTGLDGSALFSDALWRFIGFSFYEQIGTALNGVPIFGARSDNLPLDACGGADDGSGYKLYLQTDREVAAGCFLQSPNM